MPPAAGSPPDFDEIDRQHGDVLDRLAELEARVEGALEQFATRHETGQTS